VFLVSIIIQSFYFTCQYDTGTITYQPITYHYRQALADLLYAFKAKLPKNLYKGKRVERYIVKE